MSGWPTTAGATARITATARAAITPPAAAPIAAPRREPARRRPIDAASSRRSRAAASDKMRRAAPATTNCQLPPGSSAVGPMSGWRRMLQRMRKGANSEIFTRREREVLVDGEYGDDGRDQRKHGHSDQAERALDRDERR